MVQVAVPTTLTSLESFLSSYDEVMRISADGTHWLRCASGELVARDKNYTKLIYFSQSPSGAAFRRTVIQLKGGYLFITRTHRKLANREYGYQVTSAGTSGWLEKPIFVRVDVSGVRGEGTYVIRYKIKDGVSTSIK